MARSAGPPKHPPPSSQPQGPQNHKLCGVVQEAAARANERHRKRTKPQPWIVRKLMIGVTLGIMGYAAYVYIRQVCLPMIWRREGAGAGRGTGVALLVVFCVLYLWMLWAYAMVCLTSPGYAKDHVPKTERPLIPNGPIPFHHDSWASTTETDTHTHTTSHAQWPHDPEAPVSSGMGRDLAMGPRLSFQSQTHQPRRSSVSGTTSRTHGRPGSPLGRARSQSQSLSVQRAHDGLAGPSYEDLLRRDAGRLSPSQGPPSPYAERQDPNAGVLDALKKPVPFPAELRTGAEGIPPSSPTEQTRTSETAHSHSHSNSNGHAPPNPKTDVPSSPTRDHTSPTSPSFFPSKLKLKKPRPARATLSSNTSPTPTSTMKHEKALATERRLQALNVTRKPPMAPVLEPAHRYCSVDGVVKPFRAHHCRVCGTCVLKYDHHCPWIGQCVGARNHKYFLNFNQATTILTAYVLGTTVAYTVRASTSSPLGTDVNPQEIVLIALSALFLLFTLLLTASHTHLILNGQTTVESMQIRSMWEREDRTLARGFGWWDFGAKRRKQREWDQEWGRIGKEGYIWWRGSQYEHWADVMGPHWWGWILPIGRGGGDGLNYPVNPRFDAQGRWRRRAEWPEELR